VSALLFSSRDATALPETRIGGKAWQLAWLCRQGLPVPDWWVLTTEAFALQTASLQDMIDEALANLDCSDSAAVQVTATRIHQQVLALTLHPEVRSAIQGALAGVLADGESLAVRSSVVGEDAVGASFAGQMDSFLYRRGEQAVLDAVIGVMASAFNPRALQYRIQKQLPITDIRAAVIIQRMIDADAAGVMFTAHPGNGDRRRLLISATWGCGEGIVSGLCNTDEYSVSLFDDAIEADIRDKDICLRFDQAQGQGTREEVIAEALRQQPVLNDAEVLALRDLGRRIAELRGAPQDIEWARKDGQWYILQTRPITRLPFHVDSSRPVVVWDNSNIQESYCGVTTPLTFSFASRAYATVYEQTMRLLGVPDREISAHRSMLDNMLGLIRGRVYYNINNWYRGLLFLPSFSANKSDMERMMGLTDPVDFVQDSTLHWTEKLRRIPQLARALFQLWRGFRAMDQRVQQFRDHFDASYRQVNRRQLHMDSISALLDRSRWLDRTLLQNWTTPIVNDFYVMMMNGRVRRLLEQAGAAHIDALQNNLLSGEEGIESTEPTKMLLSMCDQLRADPSLRALVESHANDQLLDRLQLAAPDFYQRCCDYIERYGDRTMGELKLESITLRQDPSFMFAVLKNFLSRDDLTLASLHANEARFREQAEAEAFTLIRDRLGAGALRRFRSLLNRCRAAIRNRENMRLARTRLFGLYRDIFLEIGQQLQLLGELEQARDIFWLSLDELYAWQDGRGVQTRFKPLVAARKEEYADYQDNEPPHHFHTHGVPYLIEQYVYPFARPLDSESGSLSGIGCYPGIVEAPVRLIFSPEDELNLNGQILCTVRTDPGWAPLFPTAGGILVERGSTLSHSAVVARELGIPAIVGVPDITRILRDQERVRMDGASGTVIRLETDDGTS
jgi:rifampicin phosphotransferase